MGFTVKLTSFQCFAFFYFSETSTTLSFNCCKRLVEDNALPVIFRIINYGNRSLPWISIKQVAFNILLNLAKVGKDTYILQWMSKFWISCFLLFILYFVFSCFLSRNVTFLLLFYLSVVSIRNLCRPRNLKYLIFHYFTFDVITYLFADVRSKMASGNPALIKSQEM